MTTYRPGATIWPFLCWTLVAVGGAYFAEHHALLLPRDDPDRWVFHLIFWGCIVLGPLAFLAHFLRSRLTHVTVSPDEGLVLSSGRRIPWAAIRSVDHRAAPFKGSGPLDAVSGIDGAGGCLWISGEGCFWGLVIVAAVSIVYYIFFPVLCLLSPWHPRVVVHLKDGERLIFRDLEDDDGFVDAIRRGNGTDVRASNR